MATFIAYQPRANAPPFENHVFGESSTVASSTYVSSRQSSKSPNQTKSVGKADFVDFVDLTASHQDAPRESLVLRELLEPMCHDPDKRGIRVARARRSGVIDSDNVEDGEESDKDDGINCESEISDLPSLTDIFLRSDSGFGGSADLSYKASASPSPVDRTGKECCRESNCENSGNPAVTTAVGTQPGASQDNPIVLDDDHPVDIPDAAVSDDKNLTLEVMNREPPSGPSPALSGGLAEPDIEDGKDTPDGLAKYSTHDPVGDEKEGGSNISHKDDAFHTRTLTRGGGSDECSDSGIGSDAPASVGQIHDVFAEFEENFGVARRKQKTVVATLRDCADRGVTAGSIPGPASQGESRSAADDSAAGMDARSQSVSPLASDYHSKNASAFTEPPPSPPPMVTHEATRPDLGADSQGAPNRKRTRPPIKATVLSDDGAPCKRPRRATKETWKVKEAREAREKFEAKPSQTSLKPYRKKQTHFVSPDPGRGEVVGTVANIEDLYFGEDGTIQCLVTWKPSVIAMENCVGDKLRRRCGELFGKRYGH